MTKYGNIFKVFDQNCFSTIQNDSGPCIRDQFSNIYTILLVEICLLIWSKKILLSSVMLKAF